MRLKRFLLRYYPPGIAFEYVRRKRLKTKLLDLLDFTSSTDTTLLAREIAKKEPLITERVLAQLVESLDRLQARLISDGNVQQYSKYKTLRAHLLPLTNVTFDKQGKKCITGSYDRTCKLWDVNTGSEIHSYVGHTNVVYALAFNNPFCDKILTGSFDKTARLWSTVNGECYQTFWGHTAEVVSVKFSPQSDLVATASMDSTARLFSIVTGQETSVLQGHTAEVIALQFNNEGNQIITGSFDHTVGIWDTRTAKRIGILTGHQEEISNCLYNFSCSLVASGSMDTTAKAWDPRTLSCIATFSGHTDEVLDIAFDLRGRRLATGSSDCSAQVWDVHTSFSALATMEGHLGEVSKVMMSTDGFSNFMSLKYSGIFPIERFVNKNGCITHLRSPSGMQLLTASSDNTARLWDPETGNCVQILKGHKDDVFSCAFNYRGDTIITASKDNTCRIWR